MLRSLRFRIGLALAIVQALVLAAIVWNGISNFRHSYEHRLFDNAQNLAVQFAATTSRFLFEMDTARLEEYVEQTMTHNELLYLAVYDSRSRLVSQYGPVPEPGLFNQDNDVHAIDDRVLDVAQPVVSNGEKLGHVNLGFTLELMEKTLKEARDQSIFLALILIVLSTVTAYFIGRSLTRDLSDVSAAVEEYATGEGNLSALDPSSTEVRSVVDSLRTMARIRDNAKQERELTANFYQTLIEDSSDLVLLVKPDGNISYAGPSVQTLLGYSSASIQGRGIVDLASDDVSRDAIRRLLSNEATEGKVELNLASLDEAIRTLEVIWKDLTSDPGTAAFVLNCRDITERVAIEAQLRGKERVEAIGQLTGGIAHDFNNQLAVVLGNLDVLASGNSNVDKDKALSLAVEACNRSVKLTRSLLSFSRQSLLSPEVLQLNDVVETAASWIQQTLPSNIELQMSFQKDLWQVKLDQSAFENTLLNLIINAKDAMPDGGKLLIETCNRTVAGAEIDHGPIERNGYRYAMVSVKDSGVGIAAEFHSKIFEPFHTSKPTGRGSGLGLSSVQGFVQQSGGFIDMQSELGQGTEFELCFPATTEPRVTSSHPREAIITEKTQKARILLVEDNHEVLELTKGMLETSGHEVTTAESGESAKKVFQESADFDLLITDLMMPGEIRGVRLAEELRSIRADLPVIYISGYSTEEVLSKNQSGITDILLIKPFTNRDLLMAVDESLLV